MRRELIVIAIFLIGFGSSQIFNYFFSQKQIFQPPRTPEIFHEATNTAVLGESLLEEYARVIRVIDGDTIEIEGGKRVRYIGIDTPETVDPRKPVECFGREAAEKNRSLVEGKKVQLEKDVSEVDRYGRLLRYVSVDNQMVNDVLVRQGFAHASSYPPDIKYQEQLRDAEREARENGRGLWRGCLGESNARNTSNTSSNSNTSNSSSSSASSVSSTSCTIKGNISTSGEKIYHLPGCGSYDKTSIDESKGEKWFCSEEEAQKAGWRKAKNCL